ncbi:MAG TPA: NADP-dependent oxidoreductase [Gemmatimonadales bacterium]|nr:NADP-dependent oxidoreductase [Gemmatimonadales bacterium]
MRAIAEDEFGGPVTLMNLPIPEIGADEVLIRVRAAGVNPFDWKVADGVLKDEKEHRFPLILGSDAAGVVEQVGADVTRLFEGDEVYGYLSKPVMGMGTYAEHVGAPAVIVAKKPESVGFAEAAALPTPALTAMDLVDAVDLGDGETVLIVGATGGVGSYAVQLAARRGARVIATARRANEAFVRELGATETIDHTREDVVETVRAAHSDGIEAIIDVVSDPEALGRIAGLVKEGGRIASSVSAADVESLALRSIEAKNISMQPSAQRLEELSWMVDAGEISARLERTFPLENAREAIEESRTGHVRGKIVLLVD